MRTIIQSVVARAAFRLGKQPLLFVVTDGFHSAARALGKVSNLHRNLQRKGLDPVVTPGCVNVQEAGSPSMNVITQIVRMVRHGHHARTQ